jgi:maleamate amidohydrolase
MDNFAASGYGQGEIGFGQKCAVVIVDFQIGFTDPASPTGGSPLIQTAVDRTVDLIAFAHSKNIPVASCRVAWTGPDEMGYWKIPPLYEGGFYIGHPWTEIDPRLSDPERIFEFTKSAPSIFFKTPLVTWLTKHGVDTTIIAGCTSSGCVRASIVDSFSYGYRTIVAEDCCGDQDQEAHDSNMRDVGRRYADVMMLDDIMAALADR